MRLLAESADLAQVLSAFVRKGGWLAAPLGGAALLYLLQERLVFNPPRTAPTLQRSANHRARAVSLVMDDGAHLRGWWMRPQKTSPHLQPALLYFGGRSEEVSWASERLASLSGVYSLFVNYRGYGSSEGQPSERRIFADALELYDWLSAQPGVDRSRIAVVGRSLGTGVAAYVTAKRPVAATTLISPYDSIVELARLRFPFCAATVLLKHRFEAVQFARATQAPALVLLAETDEIVPREHAMRLFAAWHGPKQIKTIPGTNHGDIQISATTWSAIREFLTATLAHHSNEVHVCAQAMTSALSRDLDVQSVSDAEPPSTSAGHSLANLAG